MNWSQNPCHLYYINYNIVYIHHILNSVFPSRDLANPIIGYANSYFWQVHPSRWTIVENQERWWVIWNESRDYLLPIQKWTKNWTLAYMSDITHIDDSLCFPICSDFFESAWCGMLGKVSLFATVIVTLWKVIFYPDSVLFLSDHELSLFFFFWVIKKTSNRYWKP